jgi:coenzyme F420-0:L-glutamate ligase / coenzyme F420-1:gamma-L-glutamate ligase
MSELHLFPLRSLPRIQPGDDLAALLLAAVATEGHQLAAGDILIVCQKVVSKAEGRCVRYTDVQPSSLAQTIARQGEGKDPRIVEIILGQTRRIVKMDRGHLIVEAGPGWVCANAGVDESNGLSDDSVILLPEDPDASARRLRDRIAQAVGGQVAVLITDTFGRAWREGLLDVALGAAGIEPLLDLRGQQDLNGRDLHHTVVAQGDALAAAAGLLMRKGEGIAAVIARGYAFAPSDAGGAALVRAKENDLFR